MKAQRRSMQQCRLAVNGHKVRQTWVHKPDSLTRRLHTPQRTLDNPIPLKRSHTVGRTSRVSGCCHETQRWESPCRHLHHACVADTRVWQWQAAGYICGAGGHHRDDACGSMPGAQGLQLRLQPWEKAVPYGMGQLQATWNCRWNSHQGE